MRLIDADALKQAIEDKRCADCPDNAQGIRCAACQWDDAIGLIDDAPEAKRVLDLDALVDELEYIMAKTERAKDSDPDAYFRYGSARTMKVWLLRSWGEQTGAGFHGRWIKRHDGKTICSVCWMLKDISELNGCCVGCGAVMDGGSVCT